MRFWGQATGGEWRDEVAGEYEQRWYEPNGRPTGYVQQAAWDPAYGPDPEARFWFNAKAGGFGLFDRSIVVVTGGGEHRGGARLVLPLPRVWLVLRGGEHDVELRIRGDLGAGEPPTRETIEVVLHFDHHQAADLAQLIHRERLGPQFPVDVAPAHDRGGRSPGPASSGRPGGEDGGGRASHSEPPLSAVLPSVEVPEAGTPRVEPLLEQRTSPDAEGPELRGTDLAPVNRWSTPAEHRRLPVLHVQAASNQEEWVCFCPLPSSAEIVVRPVSLIAEAGERPR